MKILYRARERTCPPSRSTTLPFSPCVSLRFCRHRRAEHAPNASAADAPRPRQDRAKTTSRPRQDPANLLKKTFESSTFSSAHSSVEQHNSLPTREIRTFAIEALTCSCHNHVFAAVLQWSTENDEFTCVRSTPKSVFLGNGDDSSGARGGLATTRTLKIVAVLGNYAVFRSARALHHRNPRPSQSLSVTNIRISRTALRFC